MEERNPLEELARETAHRLRARSARCRSEQESELVGWMRGLLELTIETAHFTSAHPAQSSLDAFVASCAERRFATRDLRLAFEEAEAALGRVGGAAALPAPAALAAAVERLERDALSRFEARRAELSGSEGRLFAALLETLPEALIVADADDRICQASERLREIFGLGPTDLLGRSLHTTLSERLARQVSDPESFTEAVFLLYAAAEEQHAFTLRLKDGRRFRVRSEPLRADGQPIGRLLALAELADAGREGRRLGKRRASPPPEWESAAAVALPRAGGPAAATEALDLRTAVRLRLARFADEAGVWTQSRVSPRGGYPPEFSQLILAILEETLANVREHARASCVSVQLAERGWRAGRRLTITVSDDGRGFDVAGIDPQRGHRGLPSLREAVRFTSGTVTIESAPGKGTTVQVSLPLPQR